MKKDLYKRSISYLESKKIFIRETYIKKIKEYSETLNIVVL